MGDLLEFGSLLGGIAAVITPTNRAFALLGCVLGMLVGVAVGFQHRDLGYAVDMAIETALADGRIRRDERAMLFNCATGLKYPLPPQRRTLDRHQPIDFAAL